MKDKNYIVLVSDTEAKLVTNLPLRLDNWYCNDLSCKHCNDKYKIDCDKIIDSSPFIKNLWIVNKLIKVPMDKGKPYLVDLTGYSVDDIGVDCINEPCCGETNGCPNSKWFVTISPLEVAYIGYTPDEDSAHTEGMKDDVIQEIARKIIAIPDNLPEHSADHKLHLTFGILKDAMRMAERHASNPLPTEGQSKAVKMIQGRVKQLNDQLNDPEVLDVRRVEIKLEAYKEILVVLVEGQSETQEVSAIKELIEEMRGDGYIYYANKLEHILTRKKP